LSEISEQESNQTGAEAMILLNSISTFEFLFNITAVLSLTKMLSLQLQEKGAGISNLRLKIDAVTDSLKGQSSILRVYGMKLMLLVSN
jgi:hypothetical protein